MDLYEDNIFSPLGDGKRDADSSDQNESWKLGANWRQDTSFTEQPSKKKPTLGAAAVVPPLPIASKTLPKANKSNIQKKDRSPAKQRQHRSENSNPSTEGRTPHHTSGINEMKKQKLSPGVMLRMQSANVGPAPHPIPELMRLTQQRHLVPMTKIIDSMASLSRGGLERAQKKTNQDSCFAFRQYIQAHQAIAAVLDGHGPAGHAVSGFVKQHLPMAIAEQLKRKGEAAATSAMRSAFLEVQSALRNASNVINARLSGSTAVVSLLQGRKLTTAWVGDSRAILVRKEENNSWRGISITQDHKPTSAAELNRILAAGGRVERLSDGFGREVGPQRVWLPGSWVPGLAMSRALGDFVAQTVGVISEPDIHQVELDPRDEFLVLASDGVWEFMSAQDVADIIEKCPSAEEACKLVVEAASERWLRNDEGVVDDISVVVTKFINHNTGSDC